MIEKKYHKFLKWFRHLYDCKAKKVAYPFPTNHWDTPSRTACIVFSGICSCARMTNNLDATGHQDYCYIGTDELY